MDIDNFEDGLLSISETEWLQEKAQFCQSLYKKGLDYEPWSKARATWWYESITLFVDEFIKPDLPRPSFHDDWYWWAVKEQSYINIAPRDHAKTTVHSIIRPTWEICCDRNITFFITFATTDVARLILGQIKSQLTQNSRIRAGFGLFNPQDMDPDDRRVNQDWSQNSITVNRDDFSIKDPTVAVAGALSNVLSRRAKRLIVDDLLTDKIAFSDAESERLERWYWNDVNPVLESDGQEIITGTLYRRGDFYHQIMDQGIDKGGEYRVFIGDAVVDEATEETLWPERWSWLDLMAKRRKMGTVRFNRNYRNLVVSDEDSPFPMIWFEGGVDEKTGFYYPGCFDDTIRLGQAPGYLTGVEWLKLAVVGADPAIGTTKRSKFFSAVVLGIDFENRLVVAEIIRAKMGFVAQKRAVIDLWNKWHPRYVVVETNSYQQALKEGLEEQAPDLIVVSHVSTAQGQKKPDVGVPAMDVYFEAGKFRIPRADGRSRTMTDMLVEELHFWGRHSTSDVAMALWFAFERLKPEIKKLGILTSVENAIRGDRKRYDEQLVRGISGGLVPQRAIHMIRSRTFNAPLSRFSPLNKRRSSRQSKKEPERL